MMPRFHTCLAMMALAGLLGAQGRAGTLPGEADRSAIRLYARKAEFLLERYAPSQLRDAEVRRELKKLALRLDRMDPAHPHSPVPSWSEESYMSPIDQSAQPFYRYLPTSWRQAPQGGRPSLPLLVYLHGYSPDLDLVNWALFPPALTNLAERIGACAVYPFGRGNTDFQGIGEQDVMSVIDRMQERYGTDPDRVILVGYSMGGMGAWTLGARFAERFNGLLIVCGRGDYYTWQGVDPAILPPWERTLIDAHFLSGQAGRLRGMPILGFHGEKDFLILPSEARAAFRMVQPYTPEARLILLPEADHWIIDEVLLREDCEAWLREVIRHPRRDRTEPLGIRPGEVPSRLQNAFLDPFLFVQSAETSPRSAYLFEDRCREWLVFANAHPVRRHESELSDEDRRRYHLFVFGEPENSPLIAQVLESAGVRVEPEAFVLQGRRVPRAEHGLWLAVPSPFDSDRTVVLQCGIPWGRALPPNHRYDLLPDLLVYQAEPGRIGINRPLAAARVEADGTFTWHELPVPAP